MGEPRSKMAEEEKKEESLSFENLSFESVSALVVKWLSPVEQLSPFKVGQIQKLIADIAESAGNSELGGQIAPYFAIAQVLFLILFVAYFVIGVVALAVDAEAMDAPCAEDSWIWLYVLPYQFGWGDCGWASSKTAKRAGLMAVASLCQRTLPIVNESTPSGIHFS